jgi:hypothetical protein
VRTWVRHDKRDSDLLVEGRQPESREVAAGFKGQPVGTPPRLRPATSVLGIYRAIHIRGGDSCATPRPGRTIERLNDFCRAALTGEAA